MFWCMHGHVRVCACVREIRSFVWWSWWWLLGFLHHQFMLKTASTSTQQFQTLKEGGALLADSLPFRLSAIDPFSVLPAFAPPRKIADRSFFFVNGCVWKEALPLLKTASRSPVSNFERMPAHYKQILCLSGLISAIDPFSVLPAFAPPRKIADRSFFFGNGCVWKEALPLFWALPIYKRGRWKIWLIAHIRRSHTCISFWTLSPSVLLPLLLIGLVLMSKTLFWFLSVPSCTSMCTWALIILLQDHASMKKEKKKRTLLQLNAPSIMHRSSNLCHFHIIIYYGIRSGGNGLCKSLCEREKLSHESGWWLIIKLGCLAKLLLKVSFLHKRIIDFALLPHFSKVMISQPRSVGNKMSSMRVSPTGGK